MEKMRKVLLLGLTALAILFAGCTANVDNGPVAAKPVITVAPVSGEIISTEGVYELSVEATVSDGGILTYQWYKRNAAGTFEALEGATSTKLSVTVEGYYKVVVTNTKDGATTANEAEVYVGTDYDENAVAPVPVLREQPLSGSLNEDEEYEFEVRVYIPENGKFSYELQKYDEKVKAYIVVDADDYAVSVPVTKPVKNPTYYVVNFTVYETGLYKVKITNLYKGQTSSTTTDVVEVAKNGEVPTADPEKPFITRQPESCIFNEDGNATLSVLASVSDEGKLSYQLYHDGNAEGKEQSNGIFTVTKDGSYVIRVINTLNNKTAYTDTDEVTVSEKLAEKPTVQVQPKEGIISTATPQIEITVEASVSDGGKISYQLYKDGVLAGSEQASGVFKLSEVGDYFVRVYNTLDKSKVYADTEKVHIQSVIIEAAQVKIESDIADATYIAGDTAEDGGVVSWTASASCIDVDETHLEGALSYYWYSSSEVNYNSSSRRVVASTETFTPDTSKVGEFYYWCEVTNEAKDADAGHKTSSEATKIVKVTINEVVVEEPEIVEDIADSDLMKGFVVLSISAKVEKGVLTYQWYKLENDEFVAVENLTTPYSGLITTEGTYKVLVTNTYRGKTASVFSKVARVTAQPLTNVAVPVFGTNPASASYVIGDTVTALSAQATAVSGENILAGTVTYQWYKNTTGTTNGGEAIEGETSETFTPAITEAGTTYYYVKATATNENATGDKTKEAYSAIAAITVANIRSNVASPVISVQPASNEEAYKVGETAAALTVTAASTAEGNTVLAGELTYQWYESTTSSIEDGTAIDGATNASFTPLTTAEGTKYYFVRITATNENATVSKSATVVSEVAEISVLNTNVQKPTISAQPATKEDYVVGDEAVSLTVTASAAASGKFVLEGTLSYQWYKSANADLSAPEALVTTSTYTPDVSAIGTNYYYVVVTSTNNEATGTKTASVTSKAAKITVNEAAKKYVATPVITESDTEAVYEAGATATALSVTATAEASGENILEGTLSYQWYSNTTNSTTGGVVINGATASSYTPETTVTGTTYFYVVVTATNNEADVKTATAESSIFTVVVEPAKTSVAKPVFNTQPVSKEDYIPNETVTPLTVAAVSTANAEAKLLAGTITYQWYKNTTNSADGGIAIENETNATYSPDVSDAGTYYYYVKATATNTDATVKTTDYAYSAVATITVTDTEVANPVIGTQPVSKTDYVIGDTATALTVAVTAPASGKYVLEGALSYQWYKSSNADLSEPVALVTTVSCTPDVSAEGTTYYYVVVTSTNNEATSNKKTASVTSSAATITVAKQPDTDVATPTITVQPVSKTDYLIGDSAEVLTVAATAEAVGNTVLAGEITYEWFRSTNAVSDGTSVGTGSSYTPDISAEGTYYYYVIATATNNTATRNKTATTKSDVVTITVGEPANEPVFTTNLSSSVTCTGSSQELTVVAEGNGTITYQLYKDGVVTSDAQTSGTFTVTEDGVYKILAINVKGTSEPQQLYSNTCTVKFESSGGITFQF